MADGINRQRYHTEMLKTTYRETVFLIKGDKTKRIKVE